MIHKEQTHIQKIQGAQNYCYIDKLLLVQQIIDAAYLKCGSDWSVHIFNVFHSLIVDGEKNKVEWAKSCDSVAEFGFCTTAHPCQ